MNTKPRYQIVDELRGVAILLMVAYHFCYDLSYYNFVNFDFYNDPFWLHSRTFILSLFLSLVGISLWLSHSQQIQLNKALKRLALIAFNAALISLVTWYMFAERVVYFGVLHFIIIASLLGLLFVRYRWLCLLAGISLLAMQLFQHTWFDQPWHQWFGMMTHKPATEDYVPLVPWLGVVLLGMYFAYWIPATSRLKIVESINIPFLAKLGQHSLLIYMLHQPILLGILKLFAA
jgi:uncharacterized membrane protein